jgi:hypothetical protein
VRHYLLAFLTEDESLFVNGSTPSESATPHTEVSDATSSYGVSNALFGMAQPGGRADAWVPEEPRETLSAACKALPDIVAHRRQRFGKRNIADAKNARSYRLSQDAALSPTVL